MITLNKNRYNQLTDHFRALSRLRKNAIYIIVLFLAAGILYYSVEMIRTEQFFILFFAGRLTGWLMAVAAMIWSPVNTILLSRDKKHTLSANLLWILISAVPIVFFLVMSLLHGR